MILAVCTKLNVGQLHDPAGLLYMYCMILLLLCTVQHHDRGFTVDKIMFLAWVVVPSSPTFHVEQR